MKLVRITAVLLLIAIAVSVAVPGLWTSAGYETQFRDAPDAPPSSRFLLGTDSLGRDRLARLLHGTRTSLLLAPGAALLTCILAALAGGAAGYFGGWTDRLIGGASDVVLTLPWLFLLLSVRAFLPLDIAPAVSVGVTFLLLGLLGWAAPARVVRSAVKQLAAADFLLHARALGCTPWRIVTRVLVPNFLPVLLAQFWVVVPAFILAEATLSVLGLGIAEPFPSLGGMLRELAGGNLQTQPWIAAPAVLLTAVIAGFQLVLPREDYSL